MRTTRSAAGGRDTRLKRASLLSREALSAHGATDASYLLAALVKRFRQPVDGRDVSNRSLASVYFA